jgi:hypothetical protein
MAGSGITPLPDPDEPLPGQPVIYNTSTFDEETAREIAGLHTAVRLLTIEVQLLRDEVAALDRTRRGWVP